MGQYLRDVSGSGNVVRNAEVDIALSVAPRAGLALITDSVTAEARRGGIVGMARSKAVTGDLASVVPEQYAHLAVSGNRVR